MNLSRNSQIVFFLSLLLFPLELFARAGGGGGGGGGGGYSGGAHGGNPGLNILVVFVLGGYSCIITLLFFLKVRQSKRVLDKSESDDLMWDLGEMKNWAHDTFHSMQNAWMDRNLENVKDRITPQLYEKYKQQLNQMILNRKINMLSQIQISRVYVIGCEDYLDDARDRFIAYIKGSILDYTIDENTGETIRNKYRKLETFKDCYHFVRQNDVWLLEDIDNDATIIDVLKARNFHED